MTEAELLLVLSDMLDTKLEPVKSDIRDMKLIMENEVFPRLQNIEACYTSTYRRYQSGIRQIGAMQEDVDLLKKTVMEHSRQLAQRG